MTVRWKPYRGAAKPKPRPADPTVGIPGIPVPKADPVCPSRRFSNPEIPVVAVFDPGANGSDPTDVAGSIDFRFH